jgi:hypothetical protein
MSVGQASELNPRAAVGALSLRFQDLTPSHCGTRHWSRRASGVQETVMLLLSRNTPFPSHFAGDSRN